MRKKIKLLKAQAEFVTSEKRHTGLVAGFGSGKTYAGIIKTTLQKLKYPKIDCAYYLPTYNLIKDIAIPRFAETLDDLGLTYDINLSDKVIKVINAGQDFGRIILRTMDNPKLIVGYEVGYSLIDEVDILPANKMEDVFRNVVARNRQRMPDKEYNQLDVVGTPEGYKFFYRFYKETLSKPNLETKNKKLIRASTYDNPYLPKEYIQSLADEYSPQQLEAYLNGYFVNLTTGNVFNEFDRHENHNPRKIQDKDVLHIGIDFNITNMSAVIHVVDDDILYAVDEITGAFDTNELATIIKERYKGHRIAVYPDASGMQRKSSALGMTDFKILKQYGFVIKSNKSNPLVRDRINETNRRFREKTYFVNTDICINYTDALEQLSYDKSGQPDKTSGLDHITDAGTYFVWQKKSKKFAFR